MSAPIAAERLRALSTGRVAATHLAECLAVDFAELLHVVAPVLEPDALQRMRDAAGKGITQRMALAARLLRDSGQGDPAQWRGHASDTVRGWACYLIGSDAGTPLAEKLQAIRTLADDPHFGVREWAWLALRADIVAAPRRRNGAGTAILPASTVAGTQALFKQQPQHAVPLLDALADDPERYVQDSVGNWLNDAGKTQPQWLRGLCARWQREHHSDANAYIRKRAMRSLR